MLADILWYLWLSFSIFLEKIRIYTDGCAQGNPGPGGYAALLLRPGCPPQVLQAGYRLTTNNRMELSAVIAAIQALPKSDMQVEIYSDSQYVVYAIEKGWLKKWEIQRFKKTKNADLWAAYLEVAKGHNLRFIWLRGHSGQPENERCDQLAKEAATLPTKKDIVYEQAFLAKKASSGSIFS